MTPDPWASVKDGKWHRTTTAAQNFRDPVATLCGLTIQPHNVSPDGFPDYSRRDLHACRKCSDAIRLTLTVDV